MGDGDGGVTMMRIRLFGTTTAEVHGRDFSATEMGGAKPRQILEILALALGAPVSKDTLVETLWDGRPPTSYSATLQSYVCVLRRSLGLGSGHTSLLTTTPHGYRLDPGRVSVDVTEISLLSAGLETAPAEQGLERAESVLRLAQGELLADDPYAIWAIRARDRFRREFVPVCVHAAELAAGAGDALRAERFARAAIDRDPGSEAAVQQLMRARWSSGDRSEALRLYAGLRERLLEDVGDEPRASSRELYLAILRDSPAARPGVSTSSEAELKTLLVLVRQALDTLPVSRLPGSDSALARSTVRALAGVA